MMNSILRRKPHTGNSQVRFAVEEGIPAEPIRKTPFYRNVLLVMTEICKASQIFVGLMMAFCLSVPCLARAEAAYSDEFIEASDPAVRCVRLSAGFAYVFSNAAAGEVTVRLKSDMNLSRTLLVGGGGGGGYPVGGGGGGGGVIVQDLELKLDSYALLKLSVGAGGAVNCNGGKSSLTVGDVTTTAIGGGSGGFWGDYDGANHAEPGGSGGGGAMNAHGGSGTSGQGNDGGYAAGYTAGGGGATQVGGDGSDAKGGDGGEGLVSDITGTSVVYGSGAGGGGYFGQKPGGKGGTNAGDGGGSNNGYTSTGGTDGTGGGGGGSCADWAAASPGGSGTVILLLKPTKGFFQIENDYSDIPETAIEPAVGFDRLTAGMVATATNWTNEDKMLQGQCLG